MWGDGTGFIAQEYFDFGSGQFVGWVVLWGGPFWGWVWVGQFNWVVVVVKWRYPLTP